MALGGLWDGPGLQQALDGNKPAWVGTAPETEAPSEPGYVLVLRLLHGHAARLTGCW